MANRTVNTNQLAPNTIMMITGKLTYSRIKSQIAGEELEKDKQRRIQKGWNAIERPYTTASICDAVVNYANPQAKTLEDIYAEESLYQSSAQSGWCFSAVNKGNSLPYVAVRNPQNPNDVEQIIPEGELASGLNVTLVLRVFKAPRNNGISLDGIIVNEPIRYYNGVLGAGLAARGITFHSAQPAAVSEQEPMTNVNAGTTAPLPAMNPPYPEQPQPVASPQGNPYSTQPAYQQPQQNFAQTQMQPAPQPGQTVQPNYAQPAPATNTGYQPPFGNNYTGSENQQSGIRYNPEDRGYN